jgi:glyoxylase-like metal-dependent hydrolase (beta-lactamase superfamily II)/rhodanese-related sulfurtransferase
MILEQHYLACLAQASYLIADEASGTAVVVDPRRDVDVYVQRAAELGVTIRHVLLTHFHADFLAGHLELAERTGATIHLGARARPDYAFAPLAEGDELTFGSVRITVLETPGHTPESVCYVVFDRAVSDTEPYAVLTGDTLFIGDVGRPDLTAAVDVTREELAAQLYHSLHDKLLALPDATLVYPGHGPGSACGKSMSSETWSTLGAQRSTNYALAPQSEADFVAAVTADLLPPPGYFPLTARLNMRPHAVLDDVLQDALAPLDLAALEAPRAAGATLLDVRHKDAFAAGHLPGSINIGLDGSFASWAGNVLDLEAPIVLVCEPGDERAAALRLGRIGLDRVVGYLAGGPAGFGAAPLARAPRVEVAAAAARLEQPEPPLVLDVRQPGEHEALRVEGALSIPLGQLPARMDELPRDRPVLVHCKSGYRSMTAVSLLRRAGFEHVFDVPGGMDAWDAAGLPHRAGAGCTA